MNSFYNVKEEKNKIRHIYKAKRLELDPNKKKALDETICQRVITLASYRFADTLLLYYPLKNEIDTRPIFEDALSKGKTVAFPKCLENSIMEYRIVRSYTDLSSGKYGIMEPNADTEPYTPAQECSLCILPALVYDEKGYRLGYGKGYYDRFLSGFHGVTAGLIYSDFVVKSLPRGRFDKASDIAITEKGVITFAKN